MLKCFVYIPYRAHWCMHTYKQHSWSFFDQIKIFFSGIINFESSISPKEIKTLNKKSCSGFCNSVNRVHVHDSIINNTPDPDPRQRTWTWMFCWTKKCYCCFALVVFFLVWMLFKTLWKTKNLKWAGSLPSPSWVIWPVRTDGQLTAEHGGVLLTATFGWSKIFKKIRPALSQYWCL